MRGDGAAVRGMAVAVAAVLWLVLCVAVRSFGGDQTFVALLLIWQANVLLIPFVFGFVGITLIASSSKSQRTFLVHPATKIFTTFSAALIFFTAYTIIFSVLERLSAIWLETAKFGGSKIGLGYGAAQLFSVGVAILLYYAWLVLRPLAAQGLASWLLRAAIGMLVAAAFIYMAMGISPYVEWRA